MALTANEQLRQLLGEEIPEDGTEDDTMFTDVEIDDFLRQDEGNVERAAYSGWRVKAARLASLVDTTEGNSQKKFSQLFDNAQDMLKMYSRSSGGPGSATEGRTRIGRARRAPVQWS